MSSLRGSSAPLSSSVASDGSEIFHSTMLPSQSQLGTESGSNCAEQAHAIALGGDLATFGGSAAGEDTGVSMSPGSGGASPDQLPPSPELNRSGSTAVSGRLSSGRPPPPGQAEAAPTKLADDPSRELSRSYLDVGRDEASFRPSHGRSPRSAVLPSPPNYQQLHDSHHSSGTSNGHSSQHEGGHSPPRGHAAQGDQGGESSFFNDREAWERQQQERLRAQQRREEEASLRRSQPGRTWIEETIDGVQDAAVESGARAYSATAHAAREGYQVLT